MIELLVVIAIVALLVSILMPSLSKAREFAKRTGCSMNQRTLWSASVMFANDNNSFLPGVGENPAGRWWLYENISETTPQLPEILALGIRRMWKDESVAGATNPGGLGYLGERSLMRCPSREDRLPPKPSALGGNFDEWNLYVKYRLWNGFTSNYHYTGGSAEWVARCSCGVDHWAMYAVSLDRQDPGQTLMLDMLVKQNPANIYYSSNTQNNHVTKDQAAGANVTRIDGGVRWVGWTGPWPWAESQSFNDQWHMGLYDKALLPRGSYAASCANRSIQSNPGGSRDYFFRDPGECKIPIRGAILGPACPNGG